MTWRLFGNVKWFHMGHEKTKSNISILKPLYGGLEIIVLVLSLSRADFCQAEEAWSLNPSVRSESRYDDNVSLATEEPESQNVFRLSTAVGLIRSQANSKISSQLGLDFINYSRSDAPPETVNQFIRFSSEKVARRTKWKMDADYQSDSLLRTVELPIDFNPNDQSSDVNIALVSVPVKRNRLFLKPSFQYELTQRNRIRLGYNLTTERYDNPAGANVIDYDRHVVTTQLIHRLSRNNSITMDMRLQRFDPENNKSVNTYDLLAGFSHSYSPVNTLAFKLGAQTREIEATDGNSTGFAASVSWRGRKLLSTTLIRLEHQLYPSGFGELVETDQIIIQWRQQLSHTTQLLTKGRAFNTAPTSSVSQNGREYLQFETELQHSIDRWWSIGAAYRYRWIDRDSDPESTDSNSIFISIGYEKPLMLQ